MNYDDLASLASSMPRLPKRELRCHPYVVSQLREETQRTSSHHTDLWRAYDLLACPVYEDPDMFFGTWEFYEDDVIVASGTVM